MRESVLVCRFFLANGYIRITPSLSFRRLQRSQNEQELRQVQQDRVSHRGAKVSGQGGFCVLFFFCMRKHVPCINRNEIWI